MTFMINIDMWYNPSIGTYAYHKQFDRSVEKLVVDEGVFADIPLDEEADGEGEDLLEDEGHEEGEIDVLEGNVKNIDEVDEIEQKQKLVPRHHHAAEFVPEVLEKNGQLPHHLHIDWTVYDLFKKTALPYVEVRVFYPLQIKLESLQHRIRNLLQLLIVGFIQVLGYRVGQNWSWVGFPHQFLVKTSHIFDLKSFANLQWKNDFKSLTLFGIF